MFQLTQLPPSRFREIHHGVIGSSIGLNVMFVRLQVFAGTLWTSTSEFPRTKLRYKKLQVLSHGGVSMVGVMKCEIYFVTDQLLHMRTFESGEQFEIFLNPAFAMRVSYDLATWCARSVGGLRRIHFFVPNIERDAFCRK